MNQTNNSILSFWKNTTSLGFKDFFNSKLSNRQHWGVDFLGTPQSFKIPRNGDNIISNIFTNNNIKWITNKDDINVYQFIILMTAIINETGGGLQLNFSEQGSLKYMFNITPNGKKSSYNARNSLGNKTAYELFHDNVFMNLPARAKMYKPKNINDTAWDGTVYPNYEPIGDTYNTNYDVGGLIAECDFYKFRGRGLIQITGRENYKNFLLAIQKNISTLKPNTQSLKIINSWGNDTIDNILTKITNVELDTLFLDYSIALTVLKTDNSNRFLLKMYDVQNADEFIDIAYAYGKSIAGSAKYGTLFANRAVEILNSLFN